MVTLVCTADTQDDEGTGRFFAAGSSVALPLDQARALTKRHPGHFRTGREGDGPARTDRMMHTEGIKHG